MMHDTFRRFAHKTAGVLGSSWAFLAAVCIVVGWLLTGPIFGFSDTWQLIINTGTTIITFLMVFLIQNTQNRDALAIHLKLDELLCAIQEARTGLVSVEDLSDDELATIKHQFEEQGRGCSLDPVANMQPQLPRQQAKQPRRADSA